MVAHALVQLLASTDPLTAALALALPSGLNLLVTGMLRLGFLANLLSYLGDGRIFLSTTKRSWPSLREKPHSFLWSMAPSSERISALFHGGIA